MLGKLHSQILEGDSSALVVQAVDAIKTLCGGFNKLWRFQILGGKCIRQAAKY